MYDDRPAPRDFTPEGSPDDAEEIIEGDPSYDPAKQAPVPDDRDAAVDDITDVENPEEVVYDLEDEDEDA